MKNNIYFWILLALFFTSCKPKQNLIYMSDKSSSLEEISLAKYNGVKIQEGDILLILVSALDEIAVRPFNLSTMNKVNSQSQSSGNQTVLPSEYLVNSSGYINFPVVGEILVKGLEKQEIKAEIENRLKKYLTDPFVSVGLKNFNISVIGEVKAPGQLKSETEKLNIFQALSLAGDMTDFGDRTRVKLIRAQEGGADLVVNLDLTKSDIVFSPYYYLQQNDILYVEPSVNKQIIANSNPNRNLWLQVGGIAIGLASILVALTR